MNKKIHVKDVVVLPNQLWLTAWHVLVYIQEIVNIDNEPDHKYYVDPIRVMVVMGVYDDHPHVGHSTVFSATGLKTRIA